jgi:hypothetical protein
MVSIFPEARQLSTLIFLSGIAAITIKNFGLMKAGDCKKEGLIFLAAILLLNPLALSGQRHRTQALFGSAGRTAKDNQTGR